MSGTWLAGAVAILAVGIPFAFAGYSRRNQWEDDWRQYRIDVEAYQYKLSAWEQTREGPPPLPPLTPERMDW